MLHSLVLLLPFVAALPARPNLPELSVSQWTNIQSGFLSGAKDLSEWSFAKAHDVIHSAQEEIDAVVHANDGDETQDTIWKKLKDDPHSFSKLTKLIDFVGGTPREILDDGKLQITFFAPNNDALTPPEHHHHHHLDDHKELQSIMANPSLASISAVLDREPAYLLEDHHHDHHGHGGGDDDEDKKRKREIFKKIAAKVLAYHGLPKAYTASELAQNSTLETGLVAGRDGSYGGLHRRVRVEKSLLPPSLKLNFYARVLVSDIKAKNGVLHTLNHPLIPPPSIFQSLYLFPDFFSTLTSATQGSGGRHYLDWAYDREHSEPGKPKFHGTPLATLFAPDNKAFALLPPKLKFFLFSPFGEHILAKILSYHYLPHSLVLSEFQYHAKHEKKSFAEAVEGVFNIADDPSFRQELEVPTGLPNATLKLVLEKKKLLPIEGAVKTSITVNGQPVETIDVPAWNGAFHVIGKLLVPPHHHHDDEGNDLSAQDSWTNWEQWLPAWGAEA